MSTTPAESQYHILVVDNNPTDRERAEQVLKEESYRVTCVESGSKALEFLGSLDDRNSSRGTEVDLILTELRMPEMSGYELLKKLKASTSWKDIPVVIVSSMNEPTGLDRSLDEGAEDFILKPLFASDVEILISCILEGKAKAGEQQVASSSKQEATNEGQSSTSATAAPELHALVVNGSRVGRLCIGNLLKKHSFRVTTVASGDKALDYLISLHIQKLQNGSQEEIGVDLIITDYYMPEMTGYELLEEIKLITSARDVPVVILITDAEPSEPSELDWIESGIYGVDEVILKPFLPKEVDRLRSNVLRTKAIKAREGQASSSNKGKDAD